MKSPRRSKGYTLVELLVIIGIGAFGVTIMVPTFERSREISNRVRCASNLKQIGNAIAIYTNLYNGYYPRTFYSGGSSVIPALGGQGGDTTDTDPFVTTTTTQAQFTNNVPEALFLLLRQNGGLVSQVFVCPSSNAVADTYGGGTNTMFNEVVFSNVQQNLSYSYANPYPDNNALGSGFNLKAGGVDATFVVAADINPGTYSANNTDNVLLPTATSDMVTQRMANSNNHNKEGQNILYGDYHCDWQQTVFCGAYHDNIYTRGGPTWNATGQDLVDSPYVVNDTVLLPTDDNK